MRSLIREGLRGDNETFATLKSGSGRGTPRATLSLREVNKFMLMQEQAEKLFDKKHPKVEAAEQTEVGEGRVEMPLAATMKDVWWGFNFAFTRSERKWKVTKEKIS